MFGWFLAFVVLAFLVHWIGSEEMGMLEGIAILVAQVLLSIVTGYSYGKRQFELQNRKARGFPVIRKD